MDARAASRRGRVAWSGVLVGLGVAGFLDETVFHQLLHWHHFYDALVMYYGGDVVEVTLAALLCREWLAGPRPAARAWSTARRG